MYIHKHASYENKNDTDIKIKHINIILRCKDKQQISKIKIKIKITLRYANKKIHIYYAFTLKQNFSNYDECPNFAENCFMRTHLFVVLISVVFYRCNDNKNTIRPYKKDIIQAVYASGKIYPVDAYNVYTKLPGYISKIHVKVGDTVEAGQALITIRSEINEKNTEIAYNQLKLAQLNNSEQSPILNSLKKEINAALIKYQTDSVTYQRYSNLIKNNLVTQVQFDQIKSQYEVSKQYYQKLLNNYEQTKNQLKIEHENAQLQYEAQKANLSEYTIVSAIKGKIYDILPKEGELISNTSLLMVIGNKSVFEAELFVDETDIHLIKPDLKVVYQIDAFPNKLFSGSIKTIYQRINPVNKTCRCIADIHSDGYSFFSGLSAEANIIIAEKKQALVIPKTYLYNQTFVITKNKDTIKVKKGIEDLEYAEITEGINENTEIIQP